MLTTVCIWTALGRNAEHIDWRGVLHEAGVDVVDDRDTMTVPNHVP